MWRRSCRDAFNRLNLDRMMKRKMHVGIHSANEYARYARVCFCSHGEEADMKMIVHVDDRVQNDH